MPQDVLSIFKYMNMNLPKKIKPDNLVETIVEIRMKPMCPPELWAGMISAHIKNLGYKYIPAPQLSVRLDKNGKMAVSVESGKENTTQGIFIKGNLRFVMQSDSLSFNCNIGHYVGWDIYQKEIRNVISAIQECGIAKDFDRVQIRYISEYLNIDIIDCIKGTININSEIGPFKNQEIKLNRIDGNMKVFVSLVNMTKRKGINGEERMSSLFDVNIYEKFDSSDSVDFIIELLNKIHNAEKETFFGLLKDDFVKSLNPEY